MCRDGLAYGAADELTRAGMGRMALDHDGTAGGECRGGVTARNREGEREIAGTENRHRAERNMALAQVRARQWLAVGQGCVDAEVEPLTRPHHRGEQLQLADGAATLTFDPTPGQAGFGTGAVD